MNGQRLKQSREKLGLTQESLAELVNLSVRNITRYENGESQPTADNLASMARVLNVSVDYLVNLSDSPSPLGELSNNEKKALGAWRNGDIREAIKVIVTDKD
jgi:transcriptional regulator with XRE-family HTH domain